MRVLIVGAGIGGLTLAALLRRWDIEPDVIDRAPSFDHAGYMLGLYPLGSRILHGLGVFGAFVAASEPMDYYAVANGKGEVINRYDLGVISERFGPIRQLSRGELLGVLAASAGHPPVRMGVGIAAIEQHGGEVLARTSDGEAHRYDLVVGADGINSTVRRLVFGESAIFDTGWGGWVWWADHALAPHDTVTEYWGAGRKRIEAAQNDSRHMARMMFIETVPLAWGRDQTLKFYSLDQLVKQIAKIFEQPI